MLRVGLLALVLATVFADNFATDDKHGPLLQRLKRSPGYDCSPQYPYPPPPPFPPPPPPPPPPPYWPPPPPPPFWPPPPHAFRYPGEGSQAYATAEAGASSGARSEPIKEAPSAPAFAPEPTQAAAPEQTPAAASAPAPSSVPQGQGQASCDTCGGGSAISNAQSDLGDAIAVAIARARSG